MRFGGPIHGFSNPEEWVARHREWGYNTSYCPVGDDTPEDVVAEYARAAVENDLPIAEVGIWNNPFEGPEAIEKCKRRLELAERVGARCAVNIAGSRGGQWDGPDARNYLPETLDMIVATVREVIDDVRPQRAKYAIETMPWMVPDDAESALELVRAVDREAFGIHYDPVNMVTSPRLFYRTGEMVREFVSRVGPHIVAVHVKDIALRSKLTVHLDEVRLGLGGFDVAALVTEVQRLDPDIPLLLEHLDSEEDYRLASEAFRTGTADLQIGGTC
jgi:sugar phosphate isomerase/epimerase